MYKFLNSFKHAFRGIAISLDERNMKVHVLAVFVVTLLGVFLQISNIEWMVLLLCFGLVLSLEIINTSIELISDKLRDELKLSYEATRDIRDLSSGAVLIAVISSVIIGIFIFLPKFLDLFLI